MCCRIPNSTRIGNNDGIKYDMIKILSTNIVSPLGYTSEENYLNVKSGRTGLRRYENLWGIPETICASLFSQEQNERLMVDGLSRFESLVYYSVNDALSRAPYDVRGKKVAFILASTKGDIENLDAKAGVTTIARSAKKVAEKLGINAEPIAVCNACISGATAQLLALRLIESEIYDYAIVCGADCQCKFVVSGFSSLKALSADFCRPFDIERYGLNLGEAAATIVYGKASEDESAEGVWYLHRGAVRNDAVHICNPSKTAEGAVRAINSVLREGEDVSLVSVHGTATLYNDQMEAVALKRCGLQSVPAMALKGYFGHTMGAAGILEAIISINAADDCETLPTKGFSELGVSANVNISDSKITTKGNSVLKIIAGFGGCNAALYFSKDASESCALQSELKLKSVHSIKITPNDILVDGEPVYVEPKGMAMLTEVYKQQINDYPKYYKMDGLSRLAFIASELLLRAEGGEHDNSETRSVILFNNSSSISADLEFEKTIESSNYFPSPSVFVYTLPNIAIGEIAIRNTYFGETSFYLLDGKQPKLMDEIVSSSFLDQQMHSCISGWINYNDESDFEAELYIKEKE